MYKKEIHKQKIRLSDADIETLNRKFKGCDSSSDEEEFIPDDAFLKSFQKRVPDT